MFGSRMITFFTAALAGSTIVSALAAGPIEARAPGSGAVVAARQASDDQVSAILDDLATKIAPSVSGIQSMVSSGDVSSEKATPLFNELTGHINDASTSLGSVSPAARLRARNQPDVVAGKCATIIISITSCCQGLDIFILLVPIIGTLIAALDLALCSLLKVVEGLVAGVLVLLAGLLIDVAGLLIGLSFTLTCALIGIHL